VRVSARQHLSFALIPYHSVPDTVERAVPQELESGAPLRLLALDGLTDAANVGSLVRVAAAFGASAVLCSTECCNPFHPRAVRASAGYVFHIPIVQGDLPKMLLELGAKGVKCASAVVQDGARFLDDLGTEIPKRWTVVVGSEHFGISSAVREASGMHVKIRMAEGVDSLNVVTSAGVLLHGFIEREVAST